MTLCVGVFLSGCGKSADTVTDYGGQDSTANVSSEHLSSEVLTEGTEQEERNDTTEETEIKDARTGQKLSDWLGGKELTWEHTFMVDKYPADSNLVFHIAETREEMDALMESGFGGSSTWDTDELPAWQAKGITSDEIKEAEIVQNLLGDSAKEIRGTVGLSAGDSQNVIFACRDFIGRYENSNQDDDLFYQDYDKGAVKNEPAFFHSPFRVGATGFEPATSASRRIGRKRQSPAHRTNRDNSYIKFISYRLFYRLFLF